MIINRRLIYIWILCTSCMLYIWLSPLSSVVLANDPEDTVTLDIITIATVEDFIIFSQNCTLDSYSLNTPPTRNPFNMIALFV